MNAERKMTSCINLMNQNSPSQTSSSSDPSWWR